MLFVRYWYIDSIIYNVLFFLISQCRYKRKICFNRRIKNTIRQIRTFSWCTVNINWHWLSCRKNINSKLKREWNYILTFRLSSNVSPIILYKCKFQMISNFKQVKQLGWKCSYMYTLQWSKFTTWQIWYFWNIFRTGKDQ